MTDSSDVASFRLLATARPVALFAFASADVLLRLPQISPDEARVRTEESTGDYEAIEVYGGASSPVCASAKTGQELGVATVGANRTGS